MAYDIACLISGWHNAIWSLRHSGDLAVGSISSGRFMSIAGCHSDDLRCCPMSSWWYNVILIQSHPDDLAPDRISSEWLMADAWCHLGDLVGVYISPRWVTVNSSSRWRHNGRDSVSNHQPHDCLINRLFRRRSMKISKLCVTDRWIPRTNDQ